MSLLEIHAGEVEGSAFLLTVADWNFLCFLEAVVIENIVDVRGHVGLMEHVVFFLRQLLAFHDSARLCNALFFCVEIECGK